jgi:hypothetical protein
VISTSTTTDRVAKMSFWISVGRLVGSCRTVVAGDGGLHAIGEVDAPELFEALDDLVGHGDRILAGFFRHRDGNGGIAAAGHGVQIGTGGADTEAHITPGLIGTGVMVATSRSRIGAPLRTPTTRSATSSGVDRNVPGLDQYGLAIRHQGAGISGCVGGGQRQAQIIQGKLIAGQPLRVEVYAHHAIRAAQGFDVAGAGNPLQFGFQSAGHAQEVGGADIRIVAPQRAGDHGHVVDAFGFDQRWPDTAVCRQPVLVGVEGIV